jgi:hypothetical protein
MARSKAGNGGSGKHRREGEPPTIRLRPAEIKRAIQAQRKWYAGTDAELNCLVGRSRSGKTLFGLIIGPRHDGGQEAVVADVTQTVERIRTSVRGDIAVEVFLPPHATWQRLPRTIKTATLSWFHWQPDEKMGVSLAKIDRSTASRSVSGSGASTATARLLSHLAWLLKHFDQAEKPERSAYNAALRLWAETDKAGTPDAILPKSVRRELREKVDALVNSSQKALLEITSGSGQARRALGSPAKAVQARLTTVTRFGARAKLFDGTPLESAADSEPFSMSEVLTNLTRPNRDPEAVCSTDPRYKQRHMSALKVVLAAVASSSMAHTDAEKQRAADFLEVGGAMLEHASDDLPATATLRAARRQDKVTAALLTASTQRRRKAGQ